MAFSEEEVTTGANDKSRSIRSQLVRLGRRIASAALLFLRTPAARPGAPAGSAADEIWTEQRLTLRAWLNRNALSLAQLHEGCVAMLYLQQTPMPGWSRLVGHSVREIRNCLPDAVTGRRVRKQVQYVQRLNKIAEMWAQQGSSLPPSQEKALGDAAPSSRVPDLVTLPRRLYDDIALLIREHEEGSERRSEGAYRLFEALIPESRGQREVLEPIVNQWLTITEWFMERTHDASRDDGHFDIQEFRIQFEHFESILGALIRDFFRTTDELDKILENTNR
jgi:hypothetical protein